MVFQSTQSSLDNSYGDVTRTHASMSILLSASTVTDEGIIHRAPVQSCVGGTAAVDTYLKTGAAGCLVPLGRRGAARRPPPLGCFHLAHRVITFLGQDFSDEIPWHGHAPEETPPKKCNRRQVKDFCFTGFCSNTKEEWLIRS